MTQVRIVRGRQAGAFALIAALAVAGCSSTGTTTPSQIAAAIVNASPPPIQAPAPSASPEPSSAPASEEASGTPEPTAVVTDLDPCQLITSDDASTFVGVNFGKGKATNDREQRQDVLLRGSRPEHLHGRGRGRARCRDGAGGRGRREGRALARRARSWPSTRCRASQTIRTRRSCRARPAAMASRSAPARCCSSRAPSSSGSATSPPVVRSHRPSRRSRTRATRCSRSSPDGAASGPRAEQRSRPPRTPIDRTSTRRPCRRRTGARRARGACRSGGAGTGRRPVGRRRTAGRCRRRSDRRCPRRTRTAP